MKQNKAKFLGVLIFGLLFVFGAGLFGQQSEPCQNSDECGKIVGSLFDSDTNQLVTERFYVSFFRIIEGKPQYGDIYELDVRNGQFSVSVNPGKYKMMLNPVARDRKYPWPYKEKETIVIAKKGKITKIIKRVSVGGSLRVIFVDANGKRVNLTEHFENPKMKIVLEHYGVHRHSISVNKDQMESGEILIKDKIPGEYGINAGFSDIGLGATDKVNISIMKNETTEVRLLIDIADNTGIHGVIRRRNGGLVNLARVLLYKIVKGYGDKAYLETKTDNNGYYKLYGINEGVYSLLIQCDTDEIDLHNIALKKGQLLVKDIEVK